MDGNLVKSLVKVTVSETLKLTCFHRQCECNDCGQPLLHGTTDSPCGSNTMGDSTGPPWFFHAWKHFVSLHGSLRTKFGLIQDDHGEVDGHRSAGSVFHGSDVAWDATTENGMRESFSIRDYYNNAKRLQRQRNHQQQHQRKQPEHLYHERMDKGQE